MFAGRSQAASEPPYSSKSSSKKKNSGSNSSSASKSKRTSKSDSGKPSSSSRSINAEYPSSSRREEYQEDRRRYSSEENDDYQPATRSSTNSSSKRDNRDSSSRTSRYTPASNGRSRAQPDDDDDDNAPYNGQQSHDPGPSGNQTAHESVPQVVEPNNLSTHNASLLPNQFPNQVPHDYSIPVSRPTTPLHGLAADYYGDQGESVQFQPGVRPHTPIITDAEPHLMAALSVSNPPSETGDGAAAEFFSGTSYSPQPPDGSNSAYSAPATAAAVGSAAAGSTSSKPGKTGKTSSSHKPLLAAAGAAGLGAAAAYAHHHHHHHHNHKPQGKQQQQNGSSYASNSSRVNSAKVISSGGTTQGGRGLPDPYPVGMATSSREQYRERGTLGRFADWWNNYEDVRKMEEYTEYIGVCKYCFDPHSSPRDAPRKHQPRRRSSREFRDRKRVSKQSRYSKASSSSSDSEDEGNKGFWTAAGTAGLGALGLASADNKKSRKEFDDYSIQSGRVDPDLDVGLPQRQVTTEASTSYAQDAPEYAETSGRRQSKPTRDTRNRDDNIIGAVAGAASAAGVANVIADSATPDKRRLSSTSKRTGSARRSTVSSNDAPSQSSDSDGNVGFFGRIFSPGSSKKKKQKLRRKTSGVYQNESLNSSMVSGLAYGREDPSSRRRKSSKREPTAKDASNAILGLGAATAMLAAAGSKSHRDSGRDPELGAARDSKYKPSKPPLPRDRLQRLDEDQSDDDWEDASQSGDSSGVDTDLAFGGFHVSRPGSSKKNQHRRRSSPRATGRKASGAILPTIVASPPTIPTDMRSRNVEYEEPIDENIVSGPLRYVEPRPISDHTSSSRPPKVQSDTRDVPLQQPQPKSAVRPPSYDVVSEPPRPYVARAETVPKDISDSPFPEGYSFPKRRRTDPMSSISSMQSPMSSRPSDDVSPVSRNGSGKLARDVAIAAAVAGTAAGVASTVDDYNERRSRRQSVRFAPDEPQRRQSASQVERTSQNRNMPPETSERRPRKTFEDEPASEPSYYDPPYRSLPAANGKSNITSPVSDPGANARQRELVDPLDASAVVASGAIDPPPLDTDPMPHAVEIRRQGQIRDNHEPILDDDIMDPDFFKRRRADSEPQEQGRRRTASFYVADLEQRYSSTAPTMAEFFAPPELAHPSPAENTRVVEPPDTFSNFRRSDSITTRDISAATGPGAASQKAVPRLNVIAPTPPLSEAGSVRDPNSRSPSPLSTPMKIDEPELDQEDAQPISTPTQRVTWADQSVVNGEQTRSQPMESTSEPATPPRSSAGTDAYRTVDVRPKQYVPGSFSDDDDASVEDHKFSPPRTRKSLADVASEAMGRSMEDEEPQDNDDPTKSERGPETGELRSAPRSSEPLLEADENNDTGMRSQVQEEKDITPVSRDIEDDSSTVLPTDRSTDSLVDLERYAASSDFSETGQLSEPFQFREYKDVPEMIRLPDSPPSSPKETEDEETPSSREADRPPTTPHSGRKPSATAIPISYFRRTPQSPISKDSPTVSSPANEQSSPTTTKRTSRPNSTEFKSNEFRPLYLLERNRKPTPLEQDETYPSLPSSHTTSRASSIHGGESEEAFESARESQTASPAQSFRSLEDDYDGEYLDSQQPTPKASAISEGIEDIPDQPLEPVSADDDQIESRGATEPSIPSATTALTEDDLSSNLAEPITPTEHRELGREAAGVGTIVNEPQQDFSAPPANDLTQSLDPGDGDDFSAIQTPSKSKKGKKGKKNKKGPPAPITTTAAAAVLASAATIDPEGSAERDTVDAPVTTVDGLKDKPVTDDASSLDPPLTATREFAPEIEPPVADQSPVQTQDDSESRDLTEQVDKLEEQIIQHSQLDSTGEGPLQEPDITDDVILEDYERWKASRVPEATTRDVDEPPTQDDDLLPEDMAIVSDIINRRPSQSSTKEQPIQGPEEQPTVPEDRINVSDAAPSAEMVTDTLDPVAEPSEDLTAPAVSESREIEYEDSPDASSSYSWLPSKSKKKGKKGKKVKQVTEVFEPEPEPELVEPEPFEPEPVEPEPEPVEPEPPGPSQDVVVSSEPPSTAEEEWAIPSKGKKGKKKKQASRAIEIEPETIEPIVATPETIAEPEARKASIGEDEWDTPPTKGKKGKKKKKETVKALDSELELVESEVQPTEVSVDPEVQQPAVDEEEWALPSKGKKKKGKSRKASIPLAATAIVSAAAATAALAAGRDNHENDRNLEENAEETKEIDPSPEPASATTEGPAADAKEGQVTTDSEIVETATGPAVLEPSVVEPSPASEIEVDHPPAHVESTRGSVPLELELEPADVENVSKVPSDRTGSRQVEILEPTLEPGEIASEIPVDLTSVGAEPLMEAPAAVKETDTPALPTVAEKEIDLETQQLLEDEPTPITETVPAARDITEPETTHDTVLTEGVTTSPQVEQAPLVPEILPTAESAPTIQSASDSDALPRPESDLRSIESIEGSSEDIERDSRDIVSIPGDIPVSEHGLNEPESIAPIAEDAELEQAVIPTVEPVEVAADDEWSLPLKPSKKQKKKDKKKKSAARSLALDTSLPESSTSSDIDQIKVSEGDVVGDADNRETSATPSSGKVEKKLRFAAEPAEVIPPLSPVPPPAAAPAEPIEVVEAARSAPNIVPGAFPDPDSDDQNESSRDIETIPADQSEDTDTRQFMEELNKEEAQPSDEQEVDLPPVHGPAILSLPNKLLVEEPRSATEGDDGHTNDAVIDAAEPEEVTRPGYERQTTSDFISELREEENQSLSEDVPEPKLTESSPPEEDVDVSRSIHEDIPSMPEAEPTSQDWPSDTHDALDPGTFTEELEQQEPLETSREIAGAPSATQDEDAVIPGESAIEKDQGDDLALAEDGAAPDDQAEAEPEDEWAPAVSKSKKKKKKGKNRDADDSLEPSVTESPPAEADITASSTPENKSSKSKKGKKDKKGKKMSLFSVFGTGESSSKSKSSKKSSSKAKKEEQTESPNIEDATSTALDEPAVIEDQTVAAEQILNEESITDDTAFAQEIPSESQSREIDADQFLEEEKDLEEDLPGTTKPDERDMDSEPVPSAEIAEESALSTPHTGILPAQDDGYSTAIIPVSESQLETDLEESKDRDLSENIQPPGYYTVSDEDVEVEREATIETEAQDMLREEKELEDDRMDLNPVIPQDATEPEVNDTADSGLTYKTATAIETQPSMPTEQEESHEVTVQETMDTGVKEIATGPTETVEPEESVRNLATSEQAPIEIAPTEDAPLEDTPADDTPIEEDPPMFTVKRSKKEKKKAKKAKRTQELPLDDDAAEEAPGEDTVTSTVTREIRDPTEPVTEEISTTSEQVTAQDPIFTETLASTLEASGFNPNLATGESSDQTRSITAGTTETTKISKPPNESTAQEPIWTKQLWSFSAADNDQSTQPESTKRQAIQSEGFESERTVTRSVAGENSTEQSSRSKDTAFDDIVALSLGSAGFNPRTAEGYKARDESYPVEHRTSSMDVENEIGTVTMRTPSPKGPAEQWLSSSRGGSPVYAEPKSIKEQNMPEAEIDSSQALPEEIPFHSQKKKKKNKGKKGRKSSLEPEPYWEDQTQQARDFEQQGVAESSGTSTGALYRDSALHMPEEVDTEVLSSTYREVRDSGYHDTMPTTPASRTSEFHTDGQRTISEDVEMDPPTPSLEREPSPVESTSKERTSSLFQTAPALLAAETIREAGDHPEEDEQQQTTHASAQRDLQPTVEDAPLSPNYETGTTASTIPLYAPPHSRSTSRELGTIPEHDAGLPAVSQDVPDVPEEFAPPTLSEVANSRRPYARGSDRASPVAEFGRPLSAMSARSSNRSSSQVLRRSNPSSDLGAEFKRGEAQARALGYPANENLKKSPSEVSSKIATEPPPSYDPLKGIGRVSSRDMSDTGYYEGTGDARDSPRSPSRPQSVRTRKSLQQIADLESRLDQVKAENQALRDGRGLGPSSSTSRGLGDEAPLDSHGEVLRQKDVEINTVKASLQTLQAEISRLTQHNDQLNEQNRNLSGDTNERYAQMQVEQDELHQQWWQAARDLDDEREQHSSLKAGMETAVAQQVSSKLEDKNAEIESLRNQLTEATEKISTLQSQIQQSSTGERGLPGDGSGGSMGIDDFLNVRSDDYFESACHQLCSHVQQWVLRFSKFSDMRQCRLARDLHDEGLETRLDNAILDGTDVDIYLADRVKRRDVFMALMMTLVWEYVFTRYLFGMDRQQRQTLKNLEKTLSEVGPPRAVAQWRATTLTLLSRRPQFTQQREDDNEAVVQEVFGTLSTLLPTPRNLSELAMNSLRNVLRLAVDLSIEMRTQRPEYVMLPPLHPEYDTNGDLVRKVAFNASLMNERSGEFADNGELETQERSVRMVLFPLVVRKGDEQGEGSEEVVVAPAQVLVSRSEEEERRSAGARGGGGSSSRSARGLGTDYGNRSQMSVAPPSSGP